MNGTLENGHYTEDKTPKDNRDDVKAVQDLLSRYVGQLLYGCNDVTCTEATCATGRRNTSPKPIRDYKPRSARAIAITLVSGSKPRSRLCPKYRPENRSSKDAPDLGPRDPSAFVQQLSDTTRVQELCRNSSQVSGLDIVPRSTPKTAYSPEFYDRLNYWHHVMDGYSRCFKGWNTQTPLSQIIEKKEEIAGRLMNQCLLLLSGPVPDHDISHWMAINDTMNDGNPYSKRLEREHFDEERKGTIELLDCINHEPSFRLICQFIDVFCEYWFIETQAALDPTRCDIPNGVPTSSGHASSTMNSGARLAMFLSRSPYFKIKGLTLIWLKKAFLSDWNGDIMLPHGSIAAKALLILHNMSKVMRQDDECDPGSAAFWFELRAIPRRVDAMTVAELYMDDVKRQGHCHLLDFPSVFTSRQLATYFRAINHLRMRKAHSKAEVSSSLRERYQRLGIDIEPEDRLVLLEEHYLLLNISRQNVVKDAFDQVWQRRRCELLRPLRVRLGEANEFEIGHDLGGVQIEFFNLLWRELLKEENHMFTTDSTSGLSYFRPGSLQPLLMFELCGMLFGLAMYNGITLPINFATAFYMHLKGFGTKPAPEPVISDKWPEVSRSLNAILNEDVPDMDAVYAFEANGLRMSVVGYRASKLIVGSERVQLYVNEVSRILHHDSDEKPGEQTANRTPPSNSESAKSSEVNVEDIEEAWPGWRILKATAEPAQLDSQTRKKDFVSRYKGWLAYGSVAPQLQAFQRGFHQIIEPRAIRFLDASTFRSIVEGTSHLNILDLQRVTQYTNYDPNSRYIRSFWRLVTSWPEAKQRQLLKFVTAIERMPAGGASNFVFRIERPVPEEDTDRLPTSSTCFGTLFLPKYSSIEVLDQKLTLAFEYGLEGFGTG